MIHLIILMFHTSLIPFISFDQYFTPKFYNIPNMKICVSFAVKYNIRSSLDARFGLRGNERGSKAQPLVAGLIHILAIGGSAGPAPLAVIFHLGFGMEVHLRDIIRTSALFKSILGS